MAEFKIRDKETGEIFTIREKVGGQSQQSKQVQPQTQQSNSLMENIGETAILSNPLTAPFTQNKQIQSEVFSPLFHAGSAALADIPETIINKYLPQLKPPEQTTTLGKIARGTGEIAGFGMGLPTMAGKGAVSLATKTFPKLAGKSFLPSIAKGAIGGAVGMGAITPKEGLIAPKQRTLQAGIGGMLGALTGAIQPIAKWLNPKNQLRLAEETRNSLVKTKNNLIEKYGDVYNRTIKQGQGQVSLQEPLLNLINESDDIVNTIKGNTEISEALARGEPNAKRVMNVINTFMEKPQVIQNLSLQEADGIQKYIRNLPSIRNKLSSLYKGGQPDFTNADRVLLNFANDIKAQVMNLAPEMNLVNKEYGQFMSNYKQIRSYLKWNNSVTNFKNLHKIDPAILDKFQQVLPKDILNKVLTLNRAERIKNLMGIIGGGSAAAYIAHRYLSGKILGKD